MKSVVGTSEMDGISVEPDLEVARKYCRWIGGTEAAEFDWRLILPKGTAMPDGQPSAIKLRGSLTDKTLARKLVKANQAGRGVYVTANETDGKGVKSDNIVRICVVYADLDNGVPERWPIEPSFVVETSRGRFQTYWLAELCRREGIAEGL